MRQNLVINGQTIQPETNVLINIPLPPQYTYTPMTMPVHVFHGKRNGPKLFISTAVHDDEILKSLTLPVTVAGSERLAAAFSVH